MSVSSVFLESQVASLLFFPSLSVAFFSISSLLLGWHSRDHARSAIEDGDLFLSSSSFLLSSFFFLLSSFFFSHPESCLKFKFFFKKKSDVLGGPRGRKKDKKKKKRKGAAHSYPDWRDHGRLHAHVSEGSPFIALTRHVKLAHMLDSVVRLHN